MSTLIRKDSMSRDQWFDMLNKLSRIQSNPIVEWVKDDNDRIVAIKVKPAIAAEFAPQSA